MEKPSKWENVWTEDELAILHKCRLNNPYMSPHKVALHASEELEKAGFERTHAAVEYKVYTLFGENNAFRNRPWEPEEDRLFLKKYLYLRRRYTVKAVMAEKLQTALLKAGYRRSLSSIKTRMLNYDNHYAATGRYEVLSGIPKPKLQTERSVGADIMARPGDQDDVDLVHWYAAKRMPVKAIAKEINRPIETINHMLTLRPRKINPMPYVYYTSPSLKY